MSVLTEQYLRGDKVILMLIAAFAIGLILGALIMDFSNHRAATRKPRPARVRPVAPVKPAPRHRATPGVPMKGGQVLVENAPRPMTQDEIPAPPPRQRLDVRA